MEHSSREDLFHRTSEQPFMLIYPLKLHYCTCKDKINILTWKNRQNKIVGLIYLMFADVETKVWKQ